MSAKLTALIPMKGHSERVPKKNLKPFNGKPLYHWVVRACQEAKGIDKIVIDTDCPFIKADISDNFSDIIVIDRPLEIQGDYVSMNDIIEHDLNCLDGDYFLQTHSTNPLLKSTTIDASIEQFFENLEKFDSLFSVTKWQTRLYWGDVAPINHNPKELLRTQDLPPVFEENSNFYLFSRSSFKNSGKRIGISPNLFVMNKMEAFDIDNPEDFIMAELLHKTYYSDDNR